MLRGFDHRLGHLRAHDAAGEARRRPLGVDDGTHTQSLIDIDHRPLLLLPGPVEPGVQCSLVMSAHNSAPVDLDRLITHIDTRGWPRPAAARAAKGMLDAEKRGDRRFCPLAVPFRPQGRADQGPARRSGGAGGRGADHPDRRCGRGHRGRDRRLRVPRGRAGHEHGAADRAAGASADRHGGHHGQPLLRLLDAGDPHGGGRDPAGCGRGVRVRGRRIDDPGADRRLQLPAEPSPRGGVSPGLHEHGRDRGERGQPVPDHPGRSGGVRRPEPRQGGRCPGRGQVRRRDRADQAQRRGDRAGRLHSPRHQQGGVGGPEAGVRRARHGDRGHLLAADRWRGRGAGVHRGLRREARPRRARAHQERGGRRLPGRDHGHRARSRRRARRWRAPASRSATSSWSS